ncbi:hypothetical protein NC652_002450 [Populus alba x Populus x berolinensis]|nr:hypothetical protein NC652_002450 [Populus alba x Populus x berolinensis]
MDQVLLTCPAAVEGGDAAAGRQLVFPCLEVFVVHYELCHVEHKHACETLSFKTETFISIFFLYV